MDNSVAYIIMILSPFLWLVSKLSVHYTIMYDYMRKQHSKSYIKKKGGSIVERYFLTNFKSEINILLFYLNMFLGILVILGFVTSIIYMFLATVSYELHIIIIPKIVCYLDITLVIIRIIRLIDEKIHNKAIYKSKK